MDYRNINKGRSRGISKGVVIRNKIKEYRSKLKKGKIPTVMSNLFLLSELKYSLLQNEVDLILEKLSDESYNLICNYPIAENIKELSGSGQFVNDSDFKAEIRWVARFIIDYSFEVALFVKYQKEYDREMLNGEYGAAKDIINKIEKEISVSVWTSQQRILVSELEKGFQGNKSTLGDLVSDENESLVNFILSYTSIRIEKNISTSQYRSFVDKYNSALNSKELTKYSLFKIDFFRNLDYGDLSIILAYDSTLSIIDRYIIFVQIAQLTLSSPQSSIDNNSYLLMKIKEISNVIGDEKLFSLLTIKDGVVKQIDNDFLNILDNYSEENYLNVIERAKLFLRYNPACTPIIVLYCKALSCKRMPYVRFTNESSILDRVIQLIISIINKDISFSYQSYNDLYKIVHLLGNHPLSVGVFQFLVEEVPNRFHNVSSIYFEKLSIFNSEKSTPYILNYLSEEKQKAFINSVTSNHGYSKTISLFETTSIINRNSSVNVDELSFTDALYFAKSNKRKSYFKEALSVYNYLGSAQKFSGLRSIKHLYFEIILGKFEVLKNLGRIVEALELVTDVTIEHPECIYPLYDPAFVEEIISSNDDRIINNICTPIYLKFYENDTEPYNIYVAYDNFLCSINCEIPRDFFQHFNHTNKRHVAFLGKVCKHEVLHSSPYFQDQEELDLARIEICNYLTTSLSELSLYESEVSDLLRKVLVRKGIKQIDYSKIYVDIKGLKSNISKELRENFNRNIDIASLSVDQINKLVESIGTLLVYYVDKENSIDTQANPESVSNVKLTSYDRFVHFSDAFLKIRDQFINNVDYGLDTYLSMRIRHGTLLGQIRSVFEAYNLVTAWSEENKSYLYNEFWLHDLINSNEIVNDILNNAFSSFSSSIDSIAEKLKAETIQIRTEKKQTNGLFDYIFSENDLLNMFSNKFGYIKDFDVFVEQVIETLWEKTEDCLTVIRNYLNSTLTQSIDHEFIKLESSVLSIKKYEFISNEDLNELINSIRDCRTAIVVEIQKISEWFKRSNKKFIEEFDFSILLDSSVTTLQRSFRNASISIENHTTVKLDGDLFPYFTDIFFYLLHNALKHSKIPIEDLAIEIRVSQNETHIDIDVINNISSDSDYISSVQESIDRVREGLDQSKTYERINKEGGTGFHKIKKTLKQDLERTDFNIHLSIFNDLYSDQTFFKSSISFEYAGLVK